MVIARDFMVLGTHRGASKQPAKLYERALKQLSRSDANLVGRNVIAGRPTDSPRLAILPNHIVSSFLRSPRFVSLAIQISEVAMVKRACVVLLVGVVGLVGSAQAGTPPSVETLRQVMKYWNWDEPTKSWHYVGGYVRCASSLQDVIDAGVSDELQVDLEYDTPFAKKGKVTVKQLKEICERSESSYHVGVFLGCLKMSMGKNDLDFATMCMNAYEEASKRVGPKAKLPYEGMGATDPATGDPLTLTLEEAKAKYCEPTLKAAAAEDAKWQEPYRKVLKADKLEVAIENEGSFFIRGKIVTDNPKKLLKANVWWREVEYTDLRCANGSKTIHRLYRYQFNAKQKLVKATDWERCGPEPASKFK